MDGPPPSGQVTSWATFGVAAAASHEQEAAASLRRPPIATRPEVRSPFGGPLAFREGPDARRGNHGSTNPCRPAMQRTRPPQFDQYLIHGGRGAENQAIERNQTACVVPPNIPSHLHATWKRQELARRHVTLGWAIEVDRARGVFEREILAACDDHDRRRRTAPQEAGADKQAFVSACVKAVAEVLRLAPPWRTHELTSTNACSRLHGAFSLEGKASVRIRKHPRETHTRCKQASVLVQRGRHLPASLADARLAGPPGTDCTSSRPARVVTGRIGKRTTAYVFKWSNPSTCLAALTDASPLLFVIRLRMGRQRLPKHS